MLIFHLKKEFFDMIKNKEKFEEYRKQTLYWQIRLEKLLENDIIGFQCGYRGEILKKKMKSIESGITYSELPKYVKRFFVNNHILPLYFRINFND